VRSLCEHRGSVADGTNIDGIYPHRLQQRRAELKFDPPNVDTQWVQQGFQVAVLLRQQQDRLTFLKAHAQHRTGCCKGTRAHDA
jgi:hypothetical protein